MIDKSSGEAETTFSSYGGERESVGLNIPLIKNKLAIYIDQLYLSDGFKQKPSSNISRRQYGALTLDPFASHKTKFTFSFENYNNYANNPNTITPVDDVTPWLNSGRPVWNPLHRNSHVSEHRPRPRFRTF